MCVDCCGGKTEEFPVDEEFVCDIDEVFSRLADLTGASPDRKVVSDPLHLITCTVQNTSFNLLYIFLFYHEPYCCSLILYSYNIQIKYCIYSNKLGR